jgi:hypothetical protein
MDEITIVYHPASTSTTRSASKRTIGGDGAAEWDEDLLEEVCRF